MISERRFAQTYTAFWAQALPMGDALVRRINLARDRCADPLESTVDSERRAIVNEAAFRLMKAAVRDGAMPWQVPVDIEVRAVCEGARAFVDRLRRSSEGPLAHVTDTEIHEAQKISNRLTRFFVLHERDVSHCVSPHFHGCGVLQSCSGDILAGNTLYEIKAGERDFRLIDVRQLITYCVLNHQAGTYSIENVGLLNPRVGVYFKSDLGSFVHAAAGRSLVELAVDVIDFLSTARGSR